jgi:hypothetical protein
MNNLRNKNLLKVRGLLRQAIQLSDSVSDIETDFPAEISGDLYNLLSKLSYLNDDISRDGE